MFVLTLPPVDASARNDSPLQALALEAAAGDTEATSKLLKALAPGMVRAARALMGPTHADLDDVVQQSLIGLVQALPAFRAECSPAHYASRIVGRTAAAARARTRLREARRDDGAEPDALLALEEALPGQVDAQRRRRAVWNLLETLPEEQSHTLGLRIVLGFSLQETAEATGVPLNTVRSRIRLAKEALRRLIDADPRLIEMLEVDR